MAMVRAWHDPRWGGFTCRIDYVDYFARASAFDSLVRDALKEARDAGQMSFHSLDVAVDLIVGMTVVARRRLIRQPVAPRAYIDEMLERSEEHTSELQSLMRNSYAVFCLQKKKQDTNSVPSRCENDAPK